MYSSLLLDTGGGIKTDRYQAERNDIPTLVIGLGGLGTAALSVLKGKIRENIRLDDQNQGPGAEYGNIRFLSIDTDPEWMLNQRFPEEETLYIRDNHLENIFHNPHMLQNIQMQPQYRQWFSSEIPFQFHYAAYGAAAIRQIGRYHLIHRIEDVYMRIHAEINAVCNAYHVNRERLTIHIVTGLSGGTGSGIFADICYITKKILQEMHLQQAKIWGYAFLPDVIENRAMHDPARVHALRRNAYASLKELDYLMNMQNTGGCFRQEYGPFYIETSEPPVDRCYMISAVDDDGAMVSAPQQYCMNVVADHIMAACVNSDSYVSNTSQIDALNSIQTPEGNYGNYCIPGAAEIKLPIPQELNWLAAACWEQSGICNKAATDEEVMQFAENRLHYTVSELRNVLMSSVSMDCPVYKPEMQTVKMISASWVHAEPIIGPMENWLHQQQGKLEQKFREMSGDSWNRDYCYKENPISCEEYLFNELIRICRDGQYGPYYAASLLDGPNPRTLIYLLEGLYTETEMRQRDARKQCEKSIEIAEQAKYEFCVSKNTFFNKRRESDAYETYLETLKRLYQLKLEVSIWEYTGKLILTLKHQTEAMNNFYFHPLKCMLKNLNDTFHINLNYLENQHDWETFYTRFPANSNEESFQSCLQHILQQQDTNQFIRIFSRYLEMFRERWMYSDEEKISSMINQFMADWFIDRLEEHHLANWDEYYMQFHDPSLTPQETRVHSEDILFRPLYRRAVPHYQTAPWTGTPAGAFECVLISVPANAYQISAGAQSFQANVNGCIQQSIQHDRIAIQRIYYGISISTYAGLQRLKEAYDSGPSVGLHLYEGETNWREILPELLH